MARIRLILPAVRKMARELGIVPCPELALAEALAEALDGMDLDEKIRLGANLAGPLSRVLVQLRGLAPPSAEPQRGLTEEELNKFLRDLEADRGAV